MSGVRHLLNLADLGPGGLRRVLDHAHARKAGRDGLPQGAADADAPLAGHVLAAIFEKPSTRTRLSFDIAMRQLGGETITLSAGDMQLGRGETIGDALVACLDNGDRGDTWSGARQLRDHRQGRARQRPATGGRGASTFRRAIATTSSRFRERRGRAVALIVNRETGSLEPT